MTAEVREVTDKSTWESFLLSFSPNTFLHAWNWGEMQRALGESVIRFGAYDGGTLVGVALGITVSARRGRFFFCPHGPLVHPHERDADTVMGALLDALTDHARQQRMDFFRVSPLVPRMFSREGWFRARGFRPAPMHMHAETMWLLDVRPSEEDLLRGMRKTTRNLIRRGARDGVRVRVSTDPADLATFERLYALTAERERFVPFRREFLEAELRAFRSDDQAALFFAEHGGDTLAGAFITIYGKTAFYHQGASSRAKPKIPAATVLQWEIIRAMKARGVETYNLWGIAPSEAPHHPWAGLTLFKQGFGGEGVDYLHAQDLPLSPWYWGTYVIERLRRWRRGYDLPETSDGTREQ